MNAGDKIESNQPADATATELLRDIAETRAEMSANLGAIEQRLDPAELREKAMVELGHVEAKVKEVLKEQLVEARTLLKAELAQAREVVVADLVVAKDHVKKELASAFDNAKQSIRAATIGKVEGAATKAGDVMNDTRDSLIDTVRQNPVPAALAGIGLAWLLMNRSSSSRRRNERSFGNGGHARQNGAGITVNGAIHAVENGAGRVVDQVGSTLGGLAHGASEAASHAVEGVSHAASRIGAQTSESAGALVHQATDAASHIAHQAQDFAHHAQETAGQVAGQLADGARVQAKRLEQGMQATLESNPIAVGAAALAVGAAFGFALPRTRREDALMGSAADGVLRSARDAAEGAIHSVQHFSEKAAKEAGEAFRDATK